MIKTSNKPRLLIALSALVLIIIIFKINHNKSQNEILSAPLQKGSIIQSIYGIGTVTASRSFALKTGVTSTIRSILVKEGDTVLAGRRLVELDQGVTFTAPFSGTITSLPTKVGETVFQQSVILTLVDLTDRYLVVSLDQKGAIKVHQGQKAKISFESLREKVFEGTVESIYSNESNFLVRIKIASLPKEILPGMTADVAIGIAEKQDVLLIPVAALLDGAVHVKGRIGKQTSVPVTLGLVDGTVAEVVSGNLKVGEQLIIEGNDTK